MKSKVICYFPGYEVGDFLKSHPETSLLINFTDEEQFIGELFSKLGKIDYILVQFSKESFISLKKHSIFFNCFHPPSHESTLFCDKLKSLNLIENSNQFDELLRFVWINLDSSIEDKMVSINNSFEIEVQKIF